MLKDKLKNYRIILASGSPRRQQFLKELQLDFEIWLKEVDEVYDTNLQAEEITNYLSELKAAAFIDELQQNDILITSDTIVWHENTALGKPKDYNEAFAMLASLSGKTHKVITSVCLQTPSKKVVFHDTTEVTFNSLSSEAIAFYLDNYKPYDKAGSYGIQEWIGLIGIAKINGSYTNVVGMPTDKLYQHLLTFV